MVPRAQLHRLLEGRGHQQDPLPAVQLPALAVPKFGVVDRALVASVPAPLQRAVPAPGASGQPPGSGGARAGAVVLLGQQGGVVLLHARALGEGEVAEVRRGGRCAASEQLQLGAAAPAALTAAVERPAPPPPCDGE